MLATDEVGTMRTVALIGSRAWTQAVACEMTMPNAWQRSVMIGSMPLCYPV